MRALATLATALILTLVASVASAQTQNVRVVWDPNSATDNVTNYVLVLDGGAPINVPLTACTTVSCEVPQTVPNGQHTATVTAVNQWGTASTSITAVIAPPKPPSNLRILKGALLGLLRGEPFRAMLRR